MNFNSPTFCTTISKKTTINIIKISSFLIDNTTFNHRFCSNSRINKVFLQLISISFNSFKLFFKLSNFNLKISIIFFKISNNLIFSSNK